MKNESEAWESNDWYEERREERTSGFDEDEDVLGKQIYDSLLGPYNPDNPFAVWNEEEEEEDEC